MSLASPRRLLPLFTALGLLACLAFARPAAAQLGTAGTLGTTTTAAATLADGDIFIGIQATEGTNLNAFQLPRFFNKANCDCTTQVFLFFTLTASGFAKRSAVPTGNVSYWIGSSCNDPILQKTNCQFLGSNQIATFMAQGRDTIPTTARAMSTNSTVATDVDGGVVSTFANGTVPNPDCTSPTNGFTQTVWAVFDYGADGTFDYSTTQAVFVDVTPPPAPTNIVVAPADEAVTVKWTPVDFSLNMDLQGYQILCARGDVPVFSKTTFGPAVMTCSTTSAPGIMGLDPLFVCSPLLNITTDSFRVKVLQNGIFYAATVVAIDNSGNALPPVLQGCDPNLSVDPNCSWQKPAKTDSFFDVYRDGNSTNTQGTPATPGAATGGFCAVAGGEGRRGWTIGLGSGAFVALATALARARRRRR